MCGAGFFHMRPTNAPCPRCHLRDRAPRAPASRARAASCALRSGGPASAGSQSRDRVCADRGPRTGAAGAAVRRESRYRAPAGQSAAVPRSQTAAQLSARSCRNRSIHRPALCVGCAGTGGRSTATPPPPVPHAARKGPPPTAARSCRASSARPSRSARHPDDRPRETPRRACAEAPPNRARPAVESIRPSRS